MKKLFYLTLVFVFAACNSANKPAQSEQPVVTAVALTEAKLHVSGMHCENCVASVTKGINELEGIDSVAVTLTDSTAFVLFDPSKADVEKIAKAIEARGYTAKIRTEGLPLNN
jgi:copper chaperone